MKHLSLLSLSVVLTAAGCTSNDKTGAGLEGSLNAPPSSAVASDGRTQTSSQADPGANGGSSLPASAPYQGASGSQNLNPAPFLAASQAQAATATTTTVAKPARSRRAGKKK